MAVLLVLTTALGACSGSLPIAPTPSLPSFSYRLEPIANVLTASDSLHLEWVPHPDPNYADLGRDPVLRVPRPVAGRCNGEARVDDLGSSFPTCPPAGATVTSQSVRTTTAAGARLKIDAAVPDRPGFYNLRQISLIGPATKADGSIGSGSLTSDRIVEVRTR